MTPWADHAEGPPVTYGPPCHMSVGPFETSLAEGISDTAFIPSAVNEALADQTFVEKDVVKMDDLAELDCGSVVGVESAGIPAPPPAPPERRWRVRDAHRPTDRPHCGR